MEQVAYAYAFSNNCYHFVADPEEATMPLSGSPPLSSHVMLGEKMKDATSSVHVATTTSAAAAVSSSTVQSPPPASRSA